MRAAWSTSAAGAPDEESSRASRRRLKWTSCARALDRSLP